MSDIAIKVEDVGKLYRLGEVGTGTLSHDLKRWWATTRGEEDPFAKVGETNDRAAKGTSEYVWALKDINFEVKQGEILGIIGRNGAGKSTLLKLLSKVTAPSTGRIKVNGRIASLLEVGTGFHPELTGRENVFLNGAILGMTKEEINRKFDEIVEFAGVERYIDTPVKRYSSGMYVRLAFSVAAYLQSETLIVDEVLAVGDSVFQRKCIDKMLDIANEGRTLLFVSHNISSIKALCKRGILMQNGTIVYDDIIDKVIDQYTAKEIQPQMEVDLTQIQRKGFANDLIFKKVLFENSPLPFGKPLKFKLWLQKNSNKEIFTDLDFGVAINDIYQNKLIHISNRFLNQDFDFKDERQIFSFSIENNLKPGIYELELFLRANDVIEDWLSEKVYFEVSEGNPYGHNDTSQIQGYFLTKFEIKEV